MIEHDRYNSLKIYLTVNLCLILIIYAFYQGNVHHSLTIEEDIFVDKYPNMEADFVDGLIVLATSLEKTVKGILNNKFSGCVNNWDVTDEEVVHKNAEVILQNDLSHKSILDYCIGLLNVDYNAKYTYQSFTDFNEKQLKSFIVNNEDPSTHHLTLSSIMKTYGVLILTIAWIIMIMMMYSVISNIRINNKLRLQNMKYEVLSIISNEYIYEYNIKKQRLLFSEKWRQLFSNEEEYQIATRKIMELLINNQSEKMNHIIRLPINNNDIRVFKVINSKIYDKHGNTDTIIGKLIDISEEEAEKAYLLVKSQVDGLTALYNAETTKELIEEKLINKSHREKDALILIDCDNFKEINDNFGHLVGNHVLEHVGKCMKEMFGSLEGAIIGRFGGDEFCIYIEKVSSVHFVKETCEKFISRIQSVEGVEVSVSVGISFVSKSESYEKVFQKADEALYQAKRLGKGKVYFYSEN